MKQLAVRIMMLICFNYTLEVTISELYTVYDTWLAVKHLLLCVVGIERDAVSIFTKYISPDAARPIPITEQIRNDIVGKKLITPPVCH